MISFQYKTFYNKHICINTENAFFKCWVNWEVVKMNPLSLSAPSLTMWLGVLPFFFVYIGDDWPSGASDFPILTLQHALWSPSRRRWSGKNISPDLIAELFTMLTFSTIIAQSHLALTWAFALCVWEECKYIFLLGCCYFFAISFFFFDLLRILWSLCWLPPPHCQVFTVSEWFAFFLTLLAMLCVYCSLRHQNALQFIALLHCRLELEL